MTYVFPNTSGLERAKSDPDEPIYGGSIGSNKIFHFLRSTAGMGNSPRWDLFLINVYTLLRNAYNKGITQSAIEKMIDHDSDLYMTFIGAYMSYRRTIPASVLFYAPNYRAIPDEMLRKTSGQRSERDELYARLLQKLPKKLTEVTEDPSVRKFLVATSGNTFPHKELPEHIRTIYNGQRSRGQIGTVILTHCPIDLHIDMAIPDIELLESYTGVVYPVSEFGRKLTRDVNVPFNVATHRAFGDDVHLEGLCKGKQRTQLIALAEDKRWSVRTEGEIRNNITAAFSNISESDLLRLRL